MSDTGSLLDDVGSGIGNFFSDVGSGISSGVSSAYNSLFGSSSPSADTSFQTGGGYTPTAPGNPSGPQIGPPVASTDTSALQSFMAGGGAGAGAMPGSTQSAFSAPTNSGDFSYTSPGSNPSATGAGSTPAGAAAPAASQSILDSLGLGKTNPLGLAASTGALAYNLIEGSPTSGAEQQLKSLAASQNTQGQQLQSYLANGTLPPGAQQWVDQQTAAQSAAIKAKYANLGMSGSTAETQELNNVQTQAQSQMFQIASSLLNSGISETQASGTLYNYLMQAENADAKDVSSAIQNFVSSLGGGINLKLAS